MAAFHLGAPRRPLPVDRYVVIGNPIAHSLSPEIHARFAESTGESLRYDRMLVPPAEFARAAREFFASGGRGANVTLPFKLEAFAFADEASDRARHAGAANFLMARGDRIFADNTDGAGLVADLTRNLGLDLGGRSMLVIGAGGATRGVVAPLLAQGLRRLTIANRTLPRAQEIAAAFASLGPVEAVALEALVASDHEIVVNATSTSTRGEPLDLPGGLLRAGVFAYDMAYGPGARAFLQRATDAGARASDGLGMLVEQAAESFRLWRGRMPATAPVIAELRARAA